MRETSCLKGIQQGVTGKRTIDWAVIDHIYLHATHVHNTDKQIQLKSCVDDAVSYANLHKWGEMGSHTMSQCFRNRMDSPI